MSLCCPLRRSPLEWTALPRSDPASCSPFLFTFSVLTLLFFFSSTFRLTKLVAESLSARLEVFHSRNSATYDGSEQQATRARPLYPHMCSLLGRTRRPVPKPFHYQTNRRLARFLLYNVYDSGFLRFLPPFVGRCFFIISFYRVHDRPRVDYSLRYALSRTAVALCPCDRALSRSLSLFLSPTRPDVNLPSTFFSYHSSLLFQTLFLYDAAADLTLAGKGLTSLRTRT